MFHDFAQVWTIVAAARTLGRAPLALKVAGERLVLFRDAEGRAHGLVDRCPHRGVRLSLGRVVDGAIECPFHGWRFAGDGANTCVPWNPDARCELLAATPVPVRELGGLLWVYTAPGEAPREPDVPEVLLEPALRVCVTEAIWRTHWTRAMENMLDWPHLPFVHARPIGRDLAAQTARRMDITWEDRPWGAHTTSAIDGVVQPGSLDYRFPNAMQLQIPAGRRRLALFAVCVPVEPASTRMLLITARDFLRPRIFDPFFNLGNRRVAAEDRAIVESSDPPEVPPGGDERSVRTDGPTLRFRKIYRERLLGTSAASELVALGRARGPASA